MTESRLRKVLLEDVVIFGNEEASTTGAQSIAPDHVARRAYRDTELPARASVRSKTELQQEVEEFLFYQSELLDGQHWQAFIDLFASDGIYWMPVTLDQTEWLDSPSIFAEDKNLMRVRFERITHPNAWSQAAEWSLSHVLGNIVIESEQNDEVHTRARFHVMELRRDTVRHFGGTYHHTLVRQDEEFRIKLQRVDLMNGQAPYDFVLQAWL
jgi:3-phenylpropionate/cinnamic acid dioxygenase small subunit